MKTLMTFNRIFLALALLTSAISQTVWATSAAPQAQATQDPFDFVDFVATSPDATMLDIQASDTDKKKSVAQSIEQISGGQEPTNIHNAPARLYLTIEQRHERAVDNAIADMEKYDEEHNNDNTGMNLDDTGNPPLVCERIPQRMVVADNKDEMETASAKDYKPFACPAAQCNLHCFLADGLLFHILTIHCSKTVDPTPTRMITCKIGDLACTCNAKKDDRVCRICRCTDHYISYAAAGMQPPPPCDEKLSYLDGPFTCKDCGAHVNKYTCYTHLAADCPQKSVAAVVTPSAMEQSQ